MLIALNLTDQVRQDYITVDKNLSRSGNEIINLLNLNAEKLNVQNTNDNRANVQVKLGPYEVAILKVG